MNKVIGKKRYNTEQSQLIGSYGTYSKDNAASWGEHLYRKRNGEFFLYGEGGAESRYAISGSGGLWKSGEHITPLSVDEAKKWADEHLTNEEYQAAFGAIVDDKSKLTCHYSLSMATIERIRRAAGEQNKTLSEIVEDAIAAYVQ